MRCAAPSVAVAVYLGSIGIYFDLFSSITCSIVKFAFVFPIYFLPERVSSIERFCMFNSSGEGMIIGGTSNRKRK